MHNIEYLKMLQDSEEYISKREIKYAIAKMADDISEELHSSNPIIVTILNGGMMFSSHLQKKLKFPFECGNIYASSYDEKTNSSSGKVIIHSYNLPDIKQNRTILLVDDIFDSGKTIQFIKEFFELLWNCKVYSATLLCVDNQHQYSLPMPDFVGLYSDPDKFVFGFGLDFHGSWRGLNHIRVQRNQ